MLPALLLACREAPPPHGDDGGTHTSAVTRFTAETGDSAETAEPLRWSMISMGYVHACGLLNDGRVVCWGNEDTTVPPPGPFVAISVHEWYGCGLRPDRSVTCWPAGEHGYPWGEVVTDAPTRRGLVEVKVVEDAACAEDDQRRCTVGDLGSPRGERPRFRSSTGTSRTSSGAPWTTPEP
jgi:hypothetical protein